jgi:hypothetical protein
MMFKNRSFLVKLVKDAPPNNLFPLPPAQVMYDPEHISKSAQEFVINSVGVIVAGVVVVKVTDALCKSLILASAHVFK